MLCRRYGCLPSELLGEDADLLVRMHRLLAAARPPEAVAASPEDELANLSRGIGA